MMNLARALGRGSLIPIVARFKLQLLRKELQRFFIDNRQFSGVGNCDELESD